MPFEKNPSAEIIGFLLSTDRPRACPSNIAKLLTPTGLGRAGYILDGHRIGKLLPRYPYANAHDEPGFISGGEKETFLGALFLSFKHADIFGESR